MINGVLSILHQVVHLLHHRMLHWATLQTPSVQTIPSCDADSLIQ
jgi:hypothetical protein